MDNATETIAPEITLRCPAKLNLGLWITGRRADGYHDLFSVFLPVSLADRLSVATSLKEASSLTVTGAYPNLGPSAENLVLRAASAFAHATGIQQSFQFALEKKIPPGAGLGGGSSDAAAALMALNQLSGNPLSRDALRAIAARIGADCPFFLDPRPVVATGTGADLTPLPDPITERLSAVRLLIFKPSFGVPTPWAYRRFAEQRPAAHTPPTVISERMDMLVKNRLEAYLNALHNAFESVVSAKYLALPALLEKLREEFSIPIQMTGSGSACYAILGPDTNLNTLRSRIRDAWGNQAVIATVQAGPNDKVSL